MIVTYHISIQGEDKLIKDVFLLFKSHAIVCEFDLAKDTEAAQYTMVHVSS